MRLFVPLVALSLVLAACGGGGGTEPRKEPATATSEPTPVLEGTAKDLIDLMNQGLAVSYKVNYKTAAPEGDQGDSYVIFYRPPQARIDTIPADTTEPPSILIGGDREAETINCTGGQGQWRCARIEPLGDSLLKAAGPVIFLSAVDVASYEVTEEERTIAEEAARCFALTPKAPGSAGPAEYCLSANGVPLYVDSAAGTVEATAVSAEVSDADFTPPSPPQSQ